MLHFLKIIILALWNIFCKVVLVIQPWIREVGDVEVGEIRLHLCYLSIFISDYRLLNY